MQTSAATPRLRLPAWAAGLVGVVAGAVALGIAQLAAGLIGPQASPVVAVGGTFVDHTPPWLKDWAINAFGENDKLVLIAGIVVVLALIAVALGLLSRSSIGYGLAGLAAFGAVGVA
ncbi:MAG TPA: molybdopterin-binding oxidoreductase, partial [Thermopolyspora sp.]